MTFSESDAFWIGKPLNTEQKKTAYESNYPFVDLVAIEILEVMVTNYLNINLSGLIYFQNEYNFNTIFLADLDSNEQFTRDKDYFLKKDFGYYACG